MTRTVDDAAQGPMLAHCDVLVASGQVEATSDRRLLRERHVARLRELADRRDLWVPTFNYDFCSTLEYDVQADRSQVGALTEWIRKAAAWRTPTPVFNVSGFGAAPLVPSSGIVDPFGNDSVFAELVRRKGTILWYGAPFHTTTLIHHAERVAGGPAYRYDKDFAGEIVETGTRHSAVLRYHVRPMGHSLEYDWDRLFSKARSAGVIRTVDQRSSVFEASAADLVEHWAAQLRSDPLALLNPETRRWVSERLDRLGRSFLIGDFE